MLFEADPTLFIIIHVSPQKKKKKKFLEINLEICITNIKQINEDFFKIEKKIKSKLKNIFFMKCYPFFINLKTFCTKFYFILDECTSSI